MKGWLAEAAAVAVTGLTNGPLFLLVASNTLGRLQQTSIMWKHDFTLQTTEGDEGLKDVLTLLEGMPQSF